MGQKINPLGFRLGTTQDHHSFWFAQPKNYSEGLEEDQKIRDFIKNYVQKNLRIFSGIEGIVRIEIQKKNRPDPGYNPYGIPKVINRKSTKRNRRITDESTKRILLSKPKTQHCYHKNAKPYGNPNILAEFIAGQLKNRVSFRKAMKKAIELTEQTDTKGIQVQIAGRIDGKEIARVEWIREGRVPLQTIRAKIDYCFYTVRTIYGVLGIKIWIFIDEE
ncbi:unnamed protein product [Camellia sinensis]